MPGQDQPNWDALSSEFGRDQVRFKPGSTAKRGDEPIARAMAYIDARTVMDRLDQVLGPEGWSCTYTIGEKGLMVCNMGIRVNGEWIYKADGAGPSDFEAEKGACSGAFKRAAVRWGIGRYLYDLPSPWVACKVRQSGKFKEFKVSPWLMIDQLADRQPRRSAGGKPQENPQGKPAPAPGANDNLMTEPQHLLLQSIWKKMWGNSGLNQLAIWVKERRERGGPTKAEASKAINAGKSNRLSTLKNMGLYTDRMKPADPQKDIDF